MEPTTSYDDSILVSLSMPTVPTPSTIENVESSAGQYPDVEEDPKETSRQSSKTGPSSDQKISSGFNGTGVSASASGKL